MPGLSPPSSSTLTTNSILPQKQPAETPLDLLSLPSWQRPRTCLLPALSRPILSLLQKPLRRRPLRPLRPGRSLRRGPPRPGMDTALAFSRRHPPEWWSRAAS